MSYSAGNLLDTITRTYKNGSSVIIGVQKIGILSAPVCTANPAGFVLVTDSSLSTNRFLRTGNMKIHPVEKTFVGSQVVATVTTEGNFSSYTTQASDVTSVTYTGDATVNNLTFGLASTDIVKVGDTL